VVLGHAEKDANDAGHAGRLLAGEYFEYRALPLRDQAAETGGNLMRAIINE
jgi:hypothetical protein